MNKIVLLFNPTNWHGFPKADLPQTKERKNKNKKKKKKKQHWKKAHAVLPVPRCIAAGKEAIKSPREAVSKSKAAVVIKILPYNTTTVSKTKQKFI